MTVEVNVNVMGEQAWHKHLRVQLEETKTRLVPYGIQQEIPVIGMFIATFRTQVQSVKVPMFVVKGPHASLLSYKTAAALKLIKTIWTVTEKTTVNARKEFLKLFGELGKLKDFQVKLKISEEVKCVGSLFR